MQISADLSEIFINEKAYKIHSFFEFNSVRENDFTRRVLDENGVFFVLYLKEAFNAPFNLPVQFIIMDKSMFESAYTQMFFFKNYDENLFELVINEKDAKVFRLKR